MKSRWFEYKDAAVALRKAGMSMTLIERKLGIPRSTLSGWFKNIELSEEKRLQLMKNKQDGWAKARANAVKTHNRQKEDRLEEARNKAVEVIDQIKFDGPTLDLAFAMLYLGEGAKSGSTSLASSDPKILKFVLKVLQLNYQITPAMVRCDLHLRADQDPDQLKDYWSNQLGIPLEKFKSVSIDKRSEGKKTYDHYKGVCVLYCGSIAIQRKLVYLYTLFCEKISEL